MDLSLGYFLGQLVSNPALLITVILTIGVIIVNGWTDAPNAIATCVTTRCMRVEAAILMAAVCNFFGIVVMTFISPMVAYTVRNMVNFGENRHALIALLAAMIAIVTWASAAWKFGIPTSESHALIAGLSGAAIAINGGLTGINGSAWIKVVWGLVLTTVLSLSLGFGVAKTVQRYCSAVDRRKANPIFKKAQIVSSAMAAFMHGAQDGQKFMAVFLFGMALSQNKDVSGFDVKDCWWLLIACAVFMGLGTSMGGKKIIKSVGKDMVALKPYQGFSADIVSSFGLLLSSIFGLPVSTTHTKTVAIIGVGVANRASSVNKGVVIEMILAWVFTFPGCGLIAFLMTHLLLRIFT
jgi:PiT family inorganic phosphate transporter